MNVSMSKKYRYRNGDAARVLCIDSGNERYPVVSILENGELRTHSEDGKWLISVNSSGNDLIEISKYDDFKVDDKVIVSANNGPLFHRYFAGVDKEGRPLAFKHGATLFSSTWETTTWYNCEKYTGDNNE